MKNQPFMEIRVGDIVVLKSGGPKMTVEKVGNGVFVCKWFDGDKAERDFFPFDTVRKVVTED
jgi:uncharacterized protein YodC (DUF2158 family)